MKPIVLTMGEPAGIGGEIALRAWDALHRTEAAFFLLDDPQRVAGVARQIGLDVPVRPVAHPSQAALAFASALPVMPLSQPVQSLFGQPLPQTADAVVESIDRAIDFVIAGACAALVTNPIQKSTLYEAGFSYPGHTEYLAAKGGVARSVMMLVSAELRVVPLTIHVPISEVPALISTPLISETVETVVADLRNRFGIDHPRVAVSGLNPHAGEAGTIGTEDRDIIKPAVDYLRGTGIDIVGPLSADTMFHERTRSTYDVAICMYHDQALIPIKTLAFDRGVNVTLGLPFIRTSPDHGTALDIAGTGTASPESLIAAIQLARELATAAAGPRLR